MPPGVVHVGDSVPPSVSASVRLISISSACRSSRQHRPLDCFAALRILIMVLISLLQDLSLGTSMKKNVTALSTSKLANQGVPKVISATCHDSRRLLTMIEDEDKPRYLARRGVLPNGQASR